MAMLWFCRLLFTSERSDSICHDSFTSKKIIHFAID